MKNKVFNRTKRLLAASLLLAPMQFVMAWDGALTGKIREMHMVSGQPGNFEMRIVLDTGNICSGVTSPGAGWIYLNESDANYKATAAFLMMAYQTQQSVLLFGTLDSNKFCKLGYSVAVRP